MYDAGDGIPEDNAAALKWYMQAANRSHIKAQYNLGLKFDNGTNVLEDDETAFGWFKLAADQADGRADISWPQCMIAAKAWRKLWEAIGWYTRAAEKGFASAGFNLGLKYDIGRGTPEDDARPATGMRAPPSRAMSNRNIICRFLTRIRAEACARRPVHGRMAGAGSGRKI